MIKRILNYKLNGIYTIYFWLITTVWLIGLIISIWDKHTGKVLLIIGVIGQWIWFFYYLFYNYKFIWVRRLKVKYYLWKNQPVKVRLEVYKLTKKSLNPHYAGLGLCVLLVITVDKLGIKDFILVSEVPNKFPEFGSFKSIDAEYTIIYWWPKGELEPRQKALDECIRMCKEKIKNKQYE